MNEINSKTILKSILGSAIHYTKAIQLEQRLSDEKAKYFAYSSLLKSIKVVLQIGENNAQSNQV